MSSPPSEQSGLSARGGGGCRSPSPSPSPSGTPFPTQQLRHPLATEADSSDPASPSRANLAVPASPHAATRELGDADSPRSAASRSRATSHDGSTTAVPPPRASSGAASGRASPNDWSRATIGYGWDRRNEAAAAAAVAAPTDKAASQMTSSKTYHSLSYAPRQRQSILRTSHHPIFQSHSSQFGQAQAAASSANAAAQLQAPGDHARAASPTPLAPPFPTRQVMTQSDSKVSGRSQQQQQPSSPSSSATLPSSSAASAAAALAKMHLAEMKEAAKQLGLEERSAGWMILEALQAAREGEWAATAALVTNGEATMLLPREPPSVFSSASHLSLSFAHDHLVFNHSSGPSCPSPAALASALPADAAAPSFVTLSGLRGQFVEAKSEVGGSSGTANEGQHRRASAVVTSFIPWADMGFVHDLQNPGARRELLDGLAPLPASNDSALDGKASLAFPTFELGAYRADFPLPPPLPSHRSHARQRTQSSSRLNAAGSRASASFASLFGGSGRERRKNTGEAHQASELLETASLAVPEADGSRAASPLTARPSSGARSHSDGTSGAAEWARDDATDDAVATEPEAAKGAASDASPPASEAANATAASSVAKRPSRAISVWVVDRVVRRSSVLRAVGKVMTARISERLRRVGIDDSAIEVVCSFAAMFVPPVVQTSGGHLPGAEASGGASGHAATAASSSSSSSSSWNAASSAPIRSPTSTGSVYGVLASAPYLVEPDEMSENFQDFFASLRSQLESVEHERADRARRRSQLQHSSGATLHEQQAAMDRTDELLEVVESVVTAEVYDRIFCPSTSKDGYHDDALASRIAALNVLGLSLSHLGLHVSATTDGGDGGGKDGSPSDAAAATSKLDAVVKACGEELQKLQSPARRSPKAKLEVLVAAHRIVVEGLAGLPEIRLKDDDNDDASGDKGAAGNSTPAALDGGDVKDGQQDASRPEPNEAPIADNGVESAAAAPPRTDEATAQPMQEKKPKRSTSADLILPILIFSIVASNPPRLASNLFYIQRFRAESLVRGETSYCLVNIQAAVAFLENVDVKDLGLDASRVTGFDPIRGSAPSGRSPRANYATLGASGKGVSGGSSPSTKAAAASGPAAASSSDRDFVAQGVSLSMPLRLRGRLTQEIGDLAGISNKVITGVMGSSISAFGRMMGAGMAVGNETWERSRAEGPKTLDEIKGVLSGGRSRRLSSASTGTPRDSAAFDANDGTRDANETGAVNDSDARNTWSAGTGWPRRGTGSEAQLAATSSSYDAARDKPSIGDRLASLPMLGRFGSNSGTASSSTTGQGAGLGATLTASPGSVARELPGPPPPQKQASTPANGRTSSYLPSFGRTAATRSDMAAVAAEEKIPTSLQSPYARLSRPPTADRPVHVVLACTGSVASIKVPLIVEELMQYANVRVQVIATASSLHFFDRDELARINAASAPGRAAAEAATTPKAYTVHDLAVENLAAVRGKAAFEGGPLLAPRAHLWTDVDEWKDWKKVGDPILHIELRRWADIVLVAPCSANTLAKINGGICDTLLTSFLRALSPSTPTVLFPAMNTLMYMHPLTSRHLGFVKEVLGYEVVGPIEKKLACGDLGAGAMYEWLGIVRLVVERFGLEPAKADASTGAEPAEQGGNVGADS
ncbi:hypothetical protein ACQY0O_007888 [Thecaphora frezii]